MLVTILIFIALAFGVACFEGWLVMLLWNWLVPMIFNGPTISFWVAMGICFLFDLLFGSRVYVSKK